eukprot:1148607-Pelagomonas_calceolata.AAC.2
MQRSIPSIEISDKDAFFLSTCSLMESDSPAPQVFLIGYDPAVKADVHSKLVSLGASILTPVPPDHWLVKMKPADVAALQDAFPSTTAVSGLLLSCALWKANMDWHLL